MSYDGLNVVRIGLFLPFLKQIMSFESERGLGGSGLGMSQQCALAAKQASGVLGFI